MMDNTLGYESFLQENYATAASHYESEINVNPEIDSHYWYLGLCFLLQDQEFEAQATWFTAVNENSTDEHDLHAKSQNLVQILHNEASRFAEAQKWEEAWLIRRHAHEVVVTPNNALHLLLLSFQLDRDVESDLVELNVMEMLEKQPQNVAPEVLFPVLKHCLKSFILSPISYDMAERAVAILDSSHELFIYLLNHAIQLAYDLKQPKLAIQFANLYLSLNLSDANTAEGLRHLAAFHKHARNYKEGIEIAKKCYALSTNVADKFYTNHLLLNCLATAGGYWSEVDEICDRQRHLVNQLVSERPTDLNPGQLLRLINSFSEQSYLNDSPETFRPLQNRLAEFFQSQVVQLHPSTSGSGDSLSHNGLGEQRKTVHIGKTGDKPLTIGYLSHCFGRHSVGYLARWLIQNHDKQQFRINGYFFGDRRHLDPLQSWYFDQFSESKFISNRLDEAAQQIQDDQVDILVDLDSITLDLTCGILALKPAPVQVTWLGWDASGLPAIDYCLVDPYVVPENAQEYYSEKLWQLPQTYLAIDGFEVNTPTLRREHLGIPSDAIVYFSAQSGAKRHPDTVRLQLSILKAVPNSYFLIKGKSDHDAIVNFFGQLADEVGVSLDRIKFLPWVAEEADHRANIAIADVVLDTFPYNGATTTMETLWMGIPLVTKVGQQFAARNSYTMMMNAGIEEGIAWTDEDYVEWGVRLGTDEELRKHIHWTLMRSRHHAPLWDTQTFTTEVEKAYEQMWSLFLEQS